MPSILQSKIDVFLVFWALIDKDRCLEMYRSTFEDMNG